MKNLVYILVISLSTLLSACTLIKNHQIKTAVTEIIFTEIQQTLDQEQRMLVQGKNNRGKDFSKFVQDHTKIEIKDIKEITATDYQVEVKIHTLDPAARQMILEMLSKLDARTANAYNFAEALGLIHHERPDLQIEVDQNLPMLMHNKDGNWVR